MKPFLIALCLVLVLVALGQPGQGPYPNGVFGGPGGSHTGGGPTSPGGSNAPVNNLVVDAWFNPSASANATVVAAAMLPADFVIGLANCINTLDVQGQANSTMYVTNQGRVVWQPTLVIGGTNYTDSGTKAYANIMGHSGGPANAVFVFNINGFTNMLWQGYYTPGLPASAAVTGQDLWYTGIVGHYAIMQVFNGGGPGNYWMRIESDPGGVATFSPGIPVYQGEQLFCCLRVDTLDGTVTLRVQDVVTGYIIGQVSQSCVSGTAIDHGFVGNGSGTFSGGNSVDCLGSIVFQFNDKATNNFYTITNGFFVGYQSDVTNFLHNAIVGDSIGNGSMVSWQSLSNANTLEVSMKAAGTWTHKKAIALVCGFQKNAAKVWFKYPVGVSSFMTEDGSGQILYSESVGLTGTSSTWLDSGYNPITQGDNRASFDIECWDTTAGPSSGVQIVHMGNDSGNGHSDITMIGWWNYTPLSQMNTMFNAYTDDLSSGGFLGTTTQLTGYLEGLCNIASFTFPQFYQNGTLAIYNGAGQGSGTFANCTYGLMASHSVSTFSSESPLTYTYFAIGDGTTDPAVDYTIVHAFETSEGR